MSHTAAIATMSTTVSHVICKYLYKRQTNLWLTFSWSMWWMIFNSLYVLLAYSGEWKGLANFLIATCLLNWWSYAELCLWSQASQQTTRTNSYQTDPYAPCPMGLRFSYRVGTFQSEWAMLCSWKSAILSKWGCLWVLEQQLREFHQEWWGIWWKTIS